MDSGGGSQQVLNGLGHFDICGPDLSSLGAFYQAVVGWTVVPRGQGYAFLLTPDGSANGALVESELSAITMGVIVPDLAASLKTAEQHHGCVVMPITDNGWVRKAQVRDPAGNLITLIQGGRDQGS